MQADPCRAADAEAFPAKRQFRAEHADVVQECLRMSPYALEAVQALTEMGCPPMEVMALLPKSQSQVSASHPFCMPALCMGSNRSCLDHCIWTIPSEELKIVGCDISPSWGSHCAKG